MPANEAKNEVQRGSNEVDKSIWTRLLKRGPIVILSPTPVLKDKFLYFCYSKTKIKWVSKNWLKISELLMPEKSGKGNQNN